MLSITNGVIPSLRSVVCRQEDSVSSEGWLGSRTQILRVGEHVVLVDMQQVSSLHVESQQEPSARVLLFWGSVYSKDLTR